MKPASDSTPPLPTITTGDDGTLTYTWDTSVVITAAVGQPDRRGKYRVTAAYQGMIRSLGDVDLLNLQDRNALQAHCATLDGVVNWLQYFVQVATLLPRRDTEETWGLHARTLATIPPKRLDFYWKPFLGKGIPTIFDGDPGVGKSAVIAKIIAHLTTGRAFPTMVDGTYERDFSPQHVCLLSAEDDPATTLRPRIDLNGGDGARVHLLEGRRNSQGTVLPLTMQDLDMLRAALERYHPALLIFDPIQSFFGPGININHMTDTRPILDAVAAICRPVQCTPLYIRHLGKAAHLRALHAGVGSIDISAHMRIAVTIGRDPDDQARRIMAIAKGNPVGETPSMAFRLMSGTVEYFEGDGPEQIIVEAARVDWDGRSHLKADDITTPPPAADEDKPALEQARDFLRDFLSDGPALSEEVTKAARQAGHSFATVKRARALDNIRARRRHLDGVPSKEWPWEWLLPTDADARYPGKEEDEGPF
jgi:hypothetical protein